MLEISNLPSTFKENKYLVLPSFLTEPVLSFAYSYVMMRVRSDHLWTYDPSLNKGDLSQKKLPWDYGDPQKEELLGAQWDYADPLTEMLLEKVRPRLETATGIKLFPTYSYLRVYKKGNKLGKHRDRPSCEVSVTLTLGLDGSTKWPIYIEHPKGISAIHLNAGDALAYRGCEVPHWRDIFEGDHQVQVFMHYVDQNGLLAQWRFDKRRQLGPIPFG